jgi:hypothetical protein
MKHLGNLITELEHKIPKQEFINETVSKSSVGWHTEHTLLTINLILDQLKRSDPNDYKWKFNLRKLFIFTINKIPRGRAQSPNPVRPKNDFTTETLKKHLETVKEKIKELQTLNPNAYFTHPFFGQLNLKPTIKFLKLHTKHHIDIVNDIMKGM